MKLSKAYQLTLALVETPSLKVPIEEEIFCFFCLSSHRVYPSTSDHSKNLFLVDEGLVVSTCLGGAFIGSLFSGLVADGVGRRRAFQLSALPMIVGASVRWFVCSA